MDFENVVSDQHLRDFCAVLASAPVIAFDTEFVSEDTYLPELCLIQVAAGPTLAIIDPLEIQDLTPFWELLATPGRTVLVHAGREEFRFHMRGVGKRPADWFDIQIAAGMIGLEYPASYGTLVQKLLGKTLRKDETRTDWRRRPLSPRQLEYALQDVADLESIRTILLNRLGEMNRLHWLKDEFSAWMDDVEAYDQGERWRRVGGLAGMSPRSLALVRAIWTWRDEEAQERDAPPRRILRDDLLIELAKRQTGDLKRIRSLRGMERGDIQRFLPKIGQIIERAMQLPDSELPRPERKAYRPQLNLLGQFLSTALGGLCRQASVAPALAGTAEDVRDLVAYRLQLGSFGAGEAPSLAQGWRAEVIGSAIDQLLAGEMSIRIRDPLDDEPLAFELRRREN